MRRTLLKGALRVVARPLLNLPLPILRRAMPLLTGLLPLPAGTRLETIDLDGLPLECVNSDALPTTDHPVLLYLHGGGYVMGSARTHRYLAARLAKASGAQVFLPDYRLAPEHPHPAALDDALTAWRGLRAGGIPAQRIAVAGDSAGGGLALALALRLRELGEAMPSCLMLLSPWLDLTGSGDSYISRRHRDPYLTPAMTRRWAQAYLGDYPAKHPLCSPLFSDLKGLPAMLIQVGSEEILWSDSKRLADKATASGVEIFLEEYEGLWHVFQLHGSWLPETDAAIAKLAGYLRQRTQGNRIEVSLLKGKMGGKRVRT